jgi:hypothetical protein
MMAKRSRCSRGRLTVLWVPVLPGPGELMESLRWGASMR